MEDPVKSEEYGKLDRLAYAIPVLAHKTSLSRATIYVQVKLGLLKTVKVGRRTLVTHREAERWLASLTNR
jgi:predicted DNA-binding transcriptional regulator AlpA